MPKVFMPDVPIEQRRALLQDNCDSMEETNYIKQLTQEELDTCRETLADNSISLNDLEDELKTIKDGFKYRMEPLKKDNRRLLTCIKTRQEEVYGKLFHIADHEAGMMETFDENGEMVSSRRLRPNEKQQKLFPLKKVAE